MPKEQMTIRLYPETRRRMDSWLEESNSKNRNEFVEKALRFYMGYLGADDITEYLSDALVAALRGIIADNANRTNSLLFKCAVEQGIMAHTIAAHFRDTMEDRRALRGYVVDLAKADQTEAFVDAAVKDSGGFDILVSTVGVNCHCPAAEYKDEDMFRLLETNYLSGVRCARKVIPTMQARGGGSIINISSIHSLMSQPTNMLYAGTKGAMNAAARVMALDYAKDNIRVNTICPGVVISDVMYDDMDKLDDAGKKQLDAALHRCQPLEPGRMQDIANTALFFASNMSANITGQTLLSDSGTSIKAHDMDC